MSELLPSQPLICLASEHQRAYVTLQTSYQGY